MNKATPVEMRKCLEIVDVFKKTGIRFVAMPVIDEDDHKKLVDQMQDRLSVFAKDDQLGR